MQSLIVDSIKFKSFTKTQSLIDFCDINDSNQFSMLLSTLLISNAL